MTSTEVLQLQSQLEDVLKNLDNIQENLLHLLEAQERLNEGLRNVKERVQVLEKEVRTFDTSLAVTRTDVGWLKNLKLPIIVLSGGTGLAGLLYAIIKMMH